MGGTVRDCDHAQAEAVQEGVEVHVGRVFAMCHEKHSEHPLKTTWKEQVVFHGNHVTDHTATMAVLQDTDSACLSSASKVVDIVAASPGNSGELRYAPQACVQTELTRSSDVD